MQNYPIVYDILLRFEIEAKDEVAALKIIETDIAQFGIEEAINHSKFEIIRDDNISITGKDNLSRHINGFVVFNAEQKQALLTRIASALNAALDGDATQGNTLMNQLSKQFEYLGRSTLDGVDLS